MSGALWQLLTEHRDSIVARFVSEVAKKELSPPGLLRPLLVDHIPVFLDEIVMELTGAPHAIRFSDDAVDVSATARRHGEDRWRLGYDLEGLVREYGILRHAIIEAGKAVGTRLTLDEFDVLAKCLNVGVAEAATEFVRIHNQQLAAQRLNLEFLLESGQLLGSSLDYKSTLTRLTRLIVPRLADWCAIHVEGVPIDAMPIAHVSTDMASVLREMFERFPLPATAAYGYGELLRTGQSQLMETMPEDILAQATPEHGALLREIASCSWIMVPLRVQSTIFGAITLGCSDSGRHFGTSDLALAEELARRAAVAIDNARLYELSQAERARVEAATRAKDEFVAMVSHELRTPLNAILGWMDLVTSGSLSEDKLAHAYQVIQRNAKAQSQLVADLLDISRVLTGRIRINPALLDLSAVVDVAIDDARTALDAKGIAVDADMDRDRATMRGDVDRLQQIVWNLLSNATKFTPKGGAIRITLRRVDSDLELVIADNGIGIAPDFLPHVFEVFRQSDSTASTRLYGGLGIGLSIAKYFVELHGGSIAATSGGIGHGASFVVRLPVSAPVSPDVGVVRAPATKSGAEIGSFSQGALNGLRVLVVDDDDDGRELLALLLDACGIETRGASSAAEAIQELSTFRPDLIVSDIGMPLEDGYSLIRRIRALPRDTSLASTPVIALTAFARPEDRTQALLAGFNVHLTKPVDPKELLAAIADLAGRQSRPI